MIKRFISHKLTFSIFCVVLTISALAQDCHLIHGTLIQVANQPLFRFNSTKKLSKAGYPLTHTQFFIQANGINYKVIMDNLFYAKISLAQARSTTNLDLIDDLNRHYHVGSTTVTACGKLARNQPILSFLHADECSKRPFHGFLHVDGEDIMNNKTYCAGCICED